MLKTIVEQGIYSFQEQFDSWEEAIVASYAPMSEKGIVDAVYIQLVIDCVKKYGPYIVIAPNIAMPHSTEGAQGVSKSAIGFMKVEKPVKFDENDDEKDARLFFCLAALDHEAHLHNMMELSEMLMNDDLVEELLTAQNKEDLLRIASKYEEK